MLDLDKAGKQLDKADSFLTKLGKIGKKHWGKLIILFLLVIFGWFILLVKEEVENPSEKPYSDEYYDDIIGSDSTYYDMDEDSYYYEQSEKQ